MKRFTNILVAVDTRRQDYPELQWAIRLVEHNQAKLKVVDVVPAFSWIARLAMLDSERTKQVLADEKRQRLEAIAAPLRDQGFDVTTKVLFGKTSVEIMREVLKSSHDLVLRVTKGVHSRRTGFFGTTSLRLLHSCPCAIWLVRPDRPPQFSRILVAVDPAPHDVAQEVMNKSLMDLGRSIADFERGQLHVVNAWELNGLSADESWAIPGQLDEAMRKAKTEVVAALDDFLAPYNLSHGSKGVHLLHDEVGPGHAIAELAKQQDIDIVVMGTLSRSGVSGVLLGNTAEQVIDRVECSVLTIKPNSFISPDSVPGE
jgi:universal stress protein E